MLLVNRNRLATILSQITSLKRVYYVTGSLLQNFDFGGQVLKRCLSTQTTVDINSNSSSSSSSSSSIPYAKVLSVSAGDIITVTLPSSSSSSSTTTTTTTTTNPSSNPSRTIQATPYSLIRFERGALGLVVDVKKNNTLRVALISGPQPNPNESAIISSDGSIHSFKEEDSYSHLYTQTQSEKGISTQALLSSPPPSSPPSPPSPTTSPSSSTYPLLSPVIAANGISLLVDIKRRGREYCGRVIDSLGRPIDGQGSLSSSLLKKSDEEEEEEDFANTIKKSSDDNTVKVPSLFTKTIMDTSSSSSSSSSSSTQKTISVPLFFRSSPSIIDRTRSTNVLTTGYKAIDGFNPIILGSGTLLSGQKGTGKQKTILEIISTLSRSIDKEVVEEEEKVGEEEEVEEEKKNVTMMIYVLTGTSVSAAKNVVKSLRDTNSLHNTTVIVSTSNEPCGSQYTSMFTGLALGESIRDTGGNAVVIIDNLTRLFTSARRVAGESTLATSSSSLASPIVSATVGALFDRCGQLSNERGGGSLSVIALIDSPPISMNLSNSSSSSSSSTGNNSSSSSSSSSSSTSSFSILGKSLENTLFDYTRSLADTTIELSALALRSGSLLPIDFNSLSETSRSHIAQGKGMQLASRNAREVLCELREISKNVSIAQSVGVSMESEFDAAMSMLTKSRLLLLPTRSLLNEVFIKEDMEEGEGGGKEERSSDNTLSTISSTLSESQTVLSSHPSSSSSSSSTTTLNSPFFQSQKRSYSTSSSSSSFSTLINRYKSSLPPFQQFVGNVRSISVSSSLYSDDPSNNSSSSTPPKPEKTIEKLVNKLDAAQLRTLLAVSGNRSRKSAAAIAAHANSTISSSRMNNSSSPAISIETAAVNAAKKSNLIIETDEGEKIFSSSSSSSLSSGTGTGNEFSSLYGKRNPNTTTSNQRILSIPSISTSSSLSSSSQKTVPLSIAVSTSTVDEDEVIDGEEFHETLKRLEEKEEKGLLLKKNTNTNEQDDVSNKSEEEKSDDKKSSTTVPKSIKSSSSFIQKRDFSTLSTSISRIYISHNNITQESKQAFSFSSTPSSAAFKPIFRKLQTPPQTFADVVKKPLISSTQVDSLSSLSTSSWEDSPIRGDAKRTYLVLFCIANGYLARIPITKVFEFEAGLYSLLKTLPAPLIKYGTRLSSFSSSSTSSSSSDTLLEKVLKNGAGTDLSILNTSRPIHQSLHLLELRRIVLEARKAEEANQQKALLLQIEEKKRKEEKARKGGSTFASFFFGGTKQSSSTTTTTITTPTTPTTPTSSVASSIQLNGLSVTPSLSTPSLTSMSNSSSSSSFTSFTFDDLVEGGSIAPEGLHALYRLIDIAEKKRTRETSIPTCIDDSSERNGNIHTEKEVKEEEEENEEHLANLAALHVSIASFIKLAFDKGV
jgi:flagellar biosynthesis/type III secretory pathway ATPase